MVVRLSTTMSSKRAPVEQQLSISEFIPQPKRRKTQPRQRKAQKPRQIRRPDPKTFPSGMPPEVLEYLELVESAPYRVCDEQKALAKYVRRCFETEDIYVDTWQLEKYLSLAKYFPFELFPWEKFLTALWDCTYWRETGLPRWKTVFCLLGRGSGKDGYISFSSMCSISPYCEASSYDVDICANEEEQATRPVTDLVDVMRSPKWAVKLKKHFYTTMQLVRGLVNRGIVRGRTNSPASRDGMRTGKAIFNEVHQYQNYDNITVFRTGQGKTDHPRVGYFTSNGNISDGPLDDLVARSRRILDDGEADRGFLPFICWLHNKDEVSDPDNWYMANPSLQYRPSLLQEIRDEYEEWLERPEENPGFLVKRMGVRSQAAEVAVTDYDKIKVTNRELPDLRGWSCVVGLDYAELSDWAAVDLHFRRGNDRFDINRAWVCAQSKTLPRVRAPWRDWASKGLLTVVEDVSISPDLLAAYIQDAALLYHLKLLALDHHRWTLVSESLKKIGFDAMDKDRVKLVRPSDIMQIEPVIQECFNRGYFCWGEQPHLRWAVNNTKRVRSSKKLGVDTGNFIYAKIEAKSRKTDPWMAVVAAMVGESVLGAGMPAELPPIGAIVL